MSKDAEAAALEDGKRAAQDLQEALALIGVRLPSLAGDYPVQDRAMVTLGGAPVSEVDQLTRWIRKALDKS